MRNDSNLLTKIVCGALMGVALTWAYVRFGFELPGVARIGAKVTSEAVIATAEVDLYDVHAPLQTRQRALAVVMGQKPELFIEVDGALGNQFFEEVIRRKAVRQAKLLKGRLRAYDMALDKPALRAMYEKRFHVKDTEILKRRMLLADVRDEEILHRYLKRHFSQATLDELTGVVLNVYQNELRAPGTIRAARSAPQADSAR